MNPKEALSLDCSVFVLLYNKGDNMENAIIRLSKEGHAKLEARLNYLLTEGREEVRREIEIAKGFGDLSENAEYSAAKEKQSRMEGEIIDLTNKLQHCEIVEEEEDAGVASIGSLVRVYDEEYEEEDQYRLVGATEADPKRLFVSNESPIGRALLGARVGDTVTAETPGGTLKLRILEITK